MTAVRLIAVTAPCIEVDGKRLSAEDLMVYCARVSSPQNQANLDTGERLLRYCLRMGHYSIFEQASLTVEITTSRAISAQILRHRSFVFQEFSLRYAEAPGFETYEPRRQDTKNRQNSIDDMGAADRRWFNDAQAAVQALAKNLYEEALDLGIAKESARFLLPMSTTTRLYMTGSARSFLTYFMVRRTPETQKEHRDIADQIYEVFKEQFPITTKAYEDSRG